MKKTIIFCMVAAMSFCLTGCGTAAMVSNNITETKVVLSQNNFKVIGQAYGRSKAVYVFGIGGLSKNALRAVAIDEMSKNANLHGSQTLVNVTTHMSIKMITPIYVEIICDATANVIEFQ